MLTYSPAFTPLDFKAAIIRDPVVVSAETPIVEAIARLNCDSAPVCCAVVLENDEVVGILTERDIIRLMAEQRPLHCLTVRDVMINPVVTLCISSFTDLLFANPLFQQHPINYLPILNAQRRLVGIVTRNSLQQTTRLTDLLRLRPVADVMTRQVVQANANASLRAIAQLMAEEQVSAVVIVVTKELESGPVSIPVGLVTERELVQFQSLGGSLEDCSAVMVMTTPAVTIQAKDSLWSAQQIMEQNNTRRVVVTGEHHELLGIVTQSSLLQALNPVDLYNLAGSLERQLTHLEAEKITLLKSQANELKRQVKARTATLKAKADQEELISKLVTQIRSSLSIDTILQTTVDQIRQVAQCNRVSIWRIEPNNDLLAVAESTELGSSLVGQRVLASCFQDTWTQAYRQGKIKVISDSQATVVCDEQCALWDGLKVRAVIIVPLMCGDQLWGLLKVSEHQSPRKWRAEEIQLLQSLAGQLAIALQQATIHQQLRDELQSRHQTELLLRESEQRYASLTAAVPVVIFRADLTGTFTYINDYFTVITGFPAESALGHGWQHHLCSDDRNWVLQQWQKFIQGENTFQIEFRLQTSCGSWAWVYSQALAERDAQGIVIGYVGTLTDISDRKAVETQIAIKNELLAKIAQDEPLTEIFTTLIEAVECYLHGSLCSVLLAEDNKTLRHGAAPHLPKEYNQAIDGVNIGEGIGSCGTAAFRGEAVIVTDIATDPLWQNYKHLALQHGLRACWSMPILASNGHILGTFAVYYPEIRAPELADLELMTRMADLAGIAIERQQSATALKTSEARWQFALEGSGAGVWDWNSNTDIIFYSRQWKAMLGYADHEVGSSLEEWSSRIHPEDQEACFAALDKHFKGETGIYQNEHRLRCKDDSYRWILDCGKVVEWTPDGRPLRMIGTHTDISDRKRTEIALQNLIQGTAATTGQDFFPALASHIAEALNVAYVLVTEKIDDKLQTLAFWAQGSLQPTLSYSLAKTPCERTLQNGRFHCIDNVQELFPEDRDLVTMQANSYLGIALRDGHGQAIGNLCILDYSSIQEPQWGENILQVFAARASAELERKRAMGLLKALNQDLEAKVEERTAKLQEREQFLQTVLDTFPLSVFWKDRESVYLGCNRNFLRDAGLESTAELIGRNDYDLPWGPTEAYLYRADDQLVIQTNTAKLGTIESQIQADGQQIWLETNKIPLHNLSGDVIGVLGTYQDITDRKQAEAALRESERRYSTLAAAAPVAIFRFDPAFNCTYVSDRWSEMTGRPTTSALGQGWAEALHPEDRDRMMIPKIDPAIAVTEGNPVVNFGEGRHLKPDGSISWFYVQLVAELDSEKGVVGYIGTLTDITERKQSEAKLQQTNQELARATRLKDEFLANMSHELRTPLNAILGMTEGLQDQIFGSMSQPQLNALKTIEKSGNHLLELINDILDIAKIESGQMELDLAPTDIAALCQSSLTFIKQQAIKKRIQVNLHLENNLPSLLVDERRIRQVLINLLNNAVKFTPEQGEIKIEVSYQLCQPLAQPTISQLPQAFNDAASSGRLSIAVLDTGIGIVEEHISKLFQPFIQIDSSLNRKYEGTGLGLALVKRIVELHGGAVEVQSQVGVGSCFRIELPCMVTHQPESTSSDTPCHRGNVNASGTMKSPLILMAEDNQANISTLSSYLKAKGYRLLLAQNGREAVDLAGSNQPDLILMDLQMPEMDGLEAIQHIRQNPSLTDVPIIALTALAMEEDRERCLASGANDYLSKPVRLKELVTTIAHLLTT